MSSNCVVKKMSQNKKLLNRYTLRSKDAPLVDFALYVESQLFRGRTVDTYSIEIEHKYLENEALMPKNLPTNTRHQHFNIAEATLRLMEQFVRQRAQKTLEIYRRLN